MAAGYQELCHSLGRPRSCASQGPCVPGPTGCQAARAPSEGRGTRILEPCSEFSVTHSLSLQCPTEEVMPLVPETLDSGHCFCQETQDCYELKL